LKAYNLNDFLQLPPDPTPFHCHPILPKNGMLLLFAPTKYFKSYLTMNMGYSLAEGSDVLGIWPVQGGPKRVLLIEQECGQDEAQDRLRKIHAYRQGKNAINNLWVVSKDLDCALDTEHGLSTIQKHMDLAKPQILILDPFSWFHSRPGNDNDEIKRLAKKLLAWQMEKNLATIINLHTSKRSEFRNGDGSDVNSIKGASALAEAASSIIGMSEPTTDKTIKRLHFTLRHGKDPKPIKIQFLEESGTFVVIP
jgi:RecA-family ATPase